MSAMDRSGYALVPEKESGAGEMHCCKSSSGSSSTSHVMVSELVNDIIDNVFDVIEARNLEQTSNEEKITTNIVGDIIDNILSPSPNSVSSENSRQDEISPLGAEIKRIIEDMKFPSEEKNPICTQGVGDQLGAKLNLAPDKIISEPTKRNTLERKNRLTNLVRHSKDMLAKFVSKENENDIRMTKSEETHERLLKVIDLEGNDHKNFAEGCSSSTTGILRIPPDSTMDVVDLKPDISPVEGDTDTDTTKDGDVPDGKPCATGNKRKLSFGAKIMKCIRRSKDSKTD